MIQKSIDIVLEIEGRPLGGQTNAVLTQRSARKDISNLIKMDWQESLSGLKNWGVSCTGLFVINEAGLHAIQDAFIAGGQLTAILTLDGYKYTGQVIIDTFQTSTMEGKGANYTAALIGTGPLERVE